MRHMIGKKCLFGINCLEIWIIGKVLCYDLQSNLSLFIWAYNCVRIFFINRILLSIWNRPLSNIFDRESWFARSKKKLFHLLQWDSSVLQSLSYVSCKILAKPLFWHICSRSLYFLKVLFLNTHSTRLLINIFQKYKRHTIDHHEYFLRYFNTTIVRSLLICKLSRY